MLDGETVSSDSAGGPGGFSVIRTVTCLRGVYNLVDASLCAVLPSLSLSIHL